MVLKQCHSCTRKFTKTEHLKRHQRSHTNERPYKCVICRKCFARSDVLHRHSKCHEATTKSTNPQKISSCSGVEQSNEVPIEEDEYSHNDSEILLPELSSPFPSEQSPHQGSSQGFQSDTKLPADQPGSEVPQLRELNDFSSLAQCSALNPLNKSILEQNVFPADQPQNMQNNAMSEAGQDDIYHVNSSDYPQISTPDLYIASPLSHAWLSSIQSEAATEHNIELSRRETEDPFCLHLRTDSYPYDPLQLLLFPTAPLDFPGMSYGSGIETSQPRPVEMPYSFPSSASVETGVDSKEIPSERYERVHRCWPTFSESTTSLAKDLVLYNSACQDENIFSVLSTKTGNPASNHQHGSYRGLDNACYIRLRMEFDTVTIDRCLGLEEPLNSSSHSPSQTRRYDFPSIGLLDIALDLYFRNFHPTLPFIHIPTFCARMTPSPLLFAMCLIGLSTIRTNGATEFIAQSFPILLQKVCSDLASVPSHSGPHLEYITTVATALLVVNLAGIIGDRHCLAVTKFLYANLFSFSQQYGFFTTEWHQSLGLDSSQGQDNKQQWIVWSRAESLRRLVATLAILDSWCSNQLSITPMIRTNTLQIILPYEEALFSAQSANNWARVLDSSKSLRMPIGTSFSLDRYTLEPEEHLDTFSIFSLLCITRIRISESYHRLLPPPGKNDGEAEALIPCELFAKDLVASHLVSLSISLIHIKTVVAQESDLNNMILWNHLCLFLTSNIRVFEQAAGKEGKVPAKKSIQRIALWTQTPAARRACLHAAQIFTLVSNRKFSDSMKVRLDTVPALFIAALVLSLYVFTLRSTMPRESDKSLELLDKVDWQLLGTLGMDDGAGSTTAMIEDHSRDNIVDYPAAQFIKYGGHLTFSGNIISGDFHSARKVLLDFATLIEGLGKSNSLPSSEVLHIMADTLMQIEDEIL